MATDLHLEAQMLAVRTGLRAAACKKWMRHIGIAAITDLVKRWPSLTHAEAMKKAIGEIEDFILRDRH